MPQERCGHWHKRLQALRAELSLPLNGTHARESLALARTLLEQFSAWQKETRKRRNALGAIKEDAFVLETLGAQRLLAVLAEQLERLCEHTDHVLHKRALRTLAELSSTLARAEDAAREPTTGQREAEAFLSTVGLEKNDFELMHPYALMIPKAFLRLRNEIPTPASAKPLLLEILMKLREGVRVSADEMKKILGTWTHALSGPLTADEVFLLHDTLPRLVDFIRANRVRVVIALMPDTLPLGLALHRAWNALGGKGKLEIVFLAPKMMTRHKLAMRIAHFSTTHPVVHQRFTAGDTALILCRVADEKRFSAAQAFLAPQSSGIILRGALLARAIDRKTLDFFYGPLRAKPRFPRRHPDAPLSTSVSDVHRGDERLSRQMRALAETLRA